MREIIPFLTADPGIRRGEHVKEVLTYIGWKFYKLQNIIMSKMKLLLQVKVPDKPHNLPRSHCGARKG